LAYGNESYLKQRAKFRMSLAFLHQGGLQDELHREKITV
jgi:hypothetical protein